MNGYTRADWLERAAQLLPGATADEHEHAADLLALWYDDPTVTYDAYGPTLPGWKPATIDPRAFDGAAGGGVPNMPDAPDAWAGIQHTMGRNVAGNEVVRRRGNARVQGAPFGNVHTLPNGATGALLGQMLEDLPRNSVGAIGWQVTALTDLFFGDEIPALLGNDAKTAGEHIPAGVDLATVRGIVHASDDRGRMVWPMRTRLRRIVVRKSERAAVGSALVTAHAGRGRTVFHRQAIAPTAPARTFVCTGRVRSIPCGYLGYWHETLPTDTVRDHAGNPADQVVEIDHGALDDEPRMFVGHRVMLRGKLQRTTRGRIAARTIDLGTVTIDTAAGLATVAEAMNRDERATVRYAGLQVTICRGKGQAGTYSATVPGRGKVNGIRTTSNLVKRVTELVATS